MRRYIVISCILLIAFLSGCMKNESDIKGSFFEVAKADNKTAQRFYSVMEYIKDQIVSGEVVGAEFLVIEDREIIVHNQYGMMDKESDRQMEKDTIFRIRSMTKPFIGTCILMLAEEGKLDLSDSVSSYLSSFDNERSRFVTIEQLLTHTGGFSRTGFVKDYESYERLIDAVNDIGRKGPDLSPGSRYEYSDGGVAILGAVIAQITKMPVEEYIEKNILKRLGMSDTYCNLPAEKVVRDRISSTYYRDKDQWIKYWDSSEEQVAKYFRASGGIYSTAVDYAKFMFMWLNNGNVDNIRLLSEESVKKALMPVSHNENYGYLWERGEYFGHGGSDGTIAFAIPEYNIIVAYFTQSRSTHTVEIVKRMILKEFGADTSEQYTKIKTDPELLKEYEGIYQNSLVKLEIVAEDEGLIVKTSDSSGQVFYAASSDFFFHEILDIQLSFVRDEEGVISMVVIYQDGYIIEAEAGK